MQKSVRIADCVCIGCRSHLVADCIWLQIEFDCRLHLVTDCIWLQIAFGYRLHLVAYCIWLFLRCSCTVIFQFSEALGSFDKVEEGQKGMVYSLHDIFI